MNSFEEPVYFGGMAEAGVPPFFFALRLVRGSGLLTFHLQLIDYLLYVWHVGGEFLNPSPLGL